MNKEIIKYEGNIFTRFLGKIRCMFSKRDEIKNTEKEVNNIIPKNQEKIMPDKKEYNIDKLINKYENSKSGKENLTSDEEKFLVSYYKKRTEELDREIQYYRVELKRINGKINSYYKKAIELKGVSI